MKKFFALLALAALLLTAFAFPVLAEEPILGGWSAYTDNPTEIPTEALDALNAALDGLEGCVYKPIALLGTQIVAGTNYCFLCETTVVVPDAQPGYALVYVFDGLEGEHELLRVQEIEFSAFESTLGCRPNPLEEHSFSDAFLRFALAIRLICV